MFLLKKAFKLRDKVTPNTAEKPFLEHLEDLRNTVTKLVLTLMLTTIGCYVFHSELMEVLRRPIEEVWRLKQETKLPKNINTDVWEKAKKISIATKGYSQTERALFYQELEDPTLEHYAKAAHYYSIAKLLDKTDASEQDNKDKEAKYIRSLKLDEELQQTVLALIENQPNADANAKDKVVYMRSLKPTETFMLALKLSFFAAIIISFPLLLYFILQFVLPGLKEKEKRALWPAMAVGFGLFLTGVCFAYYIVLPLTLDFFYEFSKGMNVENEWRIGDYITFATQFTLIFGLSFELPVIVISLVKLGLLNYPAMSSSRAYAVLAIVIVAAVITPTGDALTLSLLALPMCLLYEGCIWFAYFDHKKELKKEAEEAARWQSSDKPRISSPSGTQDHDEHGDPYYHEEDYDGHGDCDYHDEDEYCDYHDDEHDEHGCLINPHGDDQMHLEHDDEGRLIQPPADDHPDSQEFHSSHDIDEEEEESTGPGHQYTDDEQDSDHSEAGENDTESCESITAAANAEIEQAKIADEAAPEENIEPIPPHETDEEKPEPPKPTHPE